MKCVVVVQIMTFFHCWNTPYGRWVLRPGYKLVLYLVLPLFEIFSIADYHFILRSFGSLLESHHCCSMHFLVKRWFLVCLHSFERLRMHVKVSPESFMFYCSFLYLRCHSGWFIHLALMRAVSRATFLLASLHQPLEGVFDVQVSLTSVCLCVAR